MRGDSRPRLSGGAKVRGRGRPRHISQPIANGPCWDGEGNGESSGNFGKESRDDAAL